MPYEMNGIAAGCLDWWQRSGLWGKFQLAKGFSPSGCLAGKQRTDEGVRRKGAGSSYFDRGGVRVVAGWFCLAVCGMTGTFAADTFVLEGRVEVRHISEATLHGATTSFQSTKEVLPNGRFKFEKLTAGSYTLAVAVAGLGESRRTVVIGPELADAKGRVQVTVKAEDFNRDAAVGQTVPMRLLQLPKEARDLFAKALKCLEKSDTACAEDRMLAAVKVAPQYAEAWNQLGTMAYHRKQYPLAAERFRKSLEADPKLYAPLVNLGGVSLNLGDHDTAWQANVQAVLREPLDALANVQLGMTYLALHKLDLAEKYLKEARRLDPAHFSYPQLHLAEVYFRRQSWAQTAGELEELLRLHPEIDGAPKLRSEIERLRKMPAP
jgi:tetratricopeptide (TPR) repeat protein